MRLHPKNLCPWPSDTLRCLPHFTHFAMKAISSRNLALQTFGKRQIWQKCGLYAHTMHGFRRYGAVFVIHLKRLEIPCDRCIRKRSFQRFHEYNPAKNVALKLENLLTATLTFTISRIVKIGSHTPSQCHDFGHLILQSSHKLDP
jgi:hypothetical protein